MTCKQMSLEYDNHLKWGKTVPIISDDEGNTTVYLTSEISEPSTYNELIQKLGAATIGDEFTFILNNGGGDVDSIIMLVDAVKHTAAIVNMQVTGFAASATTILALAGDTLTMADHSAFMIHNYSASSGGSLKGHELKAMQTFIDTSLNTAFKEFYSGFLTDEEMDEVIEGKDMWMGTEDVLTRWDLRKQMVGS